TFARPTNHWPNLKIGFVSQKAQMGADRRSSAFIPRNNASLKSPTNYTLTPQNRPEPTTVTDRPATSPTKQTANAKIGFVSQKTGTRPLCPSAPPPQTPAIDPAPRNGPAASRTNQNQNPTIGFAPQKASPNLAPPDQLLGMLQSLRSQPLPRKHPSNL